MPKSIGFWKIWSEFSQVWDDLIGSTLVDLCEIWLGSSLTCKLRDNQERFTRTLVLLAPLLGTGFKSTSLSVGIHMWVQAVWYNLLSSGVFLTYFSMLILSLSLLGLGSKSTSLSSGFCVRRARQYNSICWELNLVSGFFAFFWLIVWADGINKWGWHLAGGRGCWLSD